MNYKEMIAKAVRLDGITYDDVYTCIGVPADAKMGDYALPCFKFSKSLRKSPQAIAEETAKLFSNEKAFASVEAVSGYVNFKIDRKRFVTEAIKTAEKRGDDFKSLPPNGKTVCIDYSSVNIAKPFHIGHLLTTAIGGSLYRMYGYLGYNAVGINHLGDWGTQFGKLISAYKHWGEKTDIERRGITALSELYVRFHAEAEKNPELDKEARGYFKKIEANDSEATALFGWFKAVTLTEVEKVYKRLGIRFDSYNGESFYNDKMDAVVRLLGAKGLLTESDGAKVVDLEEDGMPPCLILKSDGASLYATRDLAAAIYREKEYGFYKNLYVVAYQQNLHFKQVFRVLEKCGFDWAKDCVHVPFGMVSLEGSGALSTRKGNVVTLDSVLQSAVEKALQIIEEKNPELTDKEETAESVGTGAVVFLALANGRIKDVVFSLDRALNFDGETAPYIQYTHARCCSVLEKCKAQSFEGEEDDLTDDEAFELIKLVSRFDSIVESAAEKYEPSILSKYLIDTAQSFNRYYISHKIAGNKARERLTRTVKAVLKNGLDLLLIKAPERM